MEKKKMSKVCKPVCQPEEPKEIEPAPKRKKYSVTGSYKTGWSQKQLPEIVKAICKKCPGLTYLEITKKKITWKYEPSLRDLIPKGKEKVENPSKRKEKVTEN